MREIKEVIKKIPNTFLFEDDFEKGIKIYSEFLTNDNNRLYDYSNALSYYIQSARNFWAYYINPTNDNLITITTRYPNGRPPFVLIYPIGNNSSKLVVEAYNLASILRNISGEKVILKKIPENYFEIFKSTGFSNYLLNDGWSVSYKYDDDQYPEFLINISRYLLNSKIELGIPIPYEPKTENLRGHSKRFIKWLNKENCKIEIQPYNYEKDYNELNILIETWAKFRKKRHHEEEYYDLINSHSCFLSNVNNLKILPNHFQSNKENGFSKSFVLSIIKKDDTIKKRIIVGFGFIDQISSETIGVYAEIALHQQDKLEKITFNNISQKGVPGCSEVLLLIMLDNALKCGFKFANLGGSESSKLFNSRIQKFPDYNTNKLGHLVLY